MAIEKTTFMATTLTDRQTEVYNWLSENATDYFGEITNNTENPKIICKIKNHENAKIVFTFNSSTYNVAITKENRNIEYGYRYQTVQDVSYTHDYAIKTNYGFYLHCSKDNDIRGGGSILVSKLNNGEIIIDFFTYVSNRVQYQNIHCLGFSKTTEIYNDINNVKGLVYKADMTTFSPIVFGEGIYSENMLLTPFSQYKGTVCTLTDDNGQKYFYDGYCALKE